MGISMQTTWENEVARLLNDLLAVQDDLSVNLAKKRELLIASDTAGLTALAPEEEQLIQRLQECVKRREELLAKAAQEGLPVESIHALAESLPPERRGELPNRLTQASSRARLLQHQSFTNWLVIQRSLIHLSQMLEIIATGGRLQPTYGKGEPVNASGAIVDRAA
jgi:flagellar biosynthesis/type III secretory pathway chaperone